ncbi:MAG: hypothetical protein ACTSO9_05500 [Candidatus Helarchaeota archaeon]
MSWDDLFAEEKKELKKEEEKEKKSQSQKKERVLFEHIKFHEFQ